MTGAGVADIAGEIAGLRVLMTADAVGGVFSYAATLAREFCARDARVTLVLQGPAASPDKRAILDGIAGLRVIDTDLALEWRDPDGADAVHARRMLQEIEADVRPDVVHLNGFREALAAFVAPTVVVAHSCVPSWWRACRGGVPDASWDRYTRNLRAGLAAAHAWIAPSRTYRDAVEELYEPPTRGHVVHNGILPGAPGPSHGRLVLAAGRVWDEAKDFATLLAAAPGIEWPVAIAGPRTPDDEGEAADAQDARDPESPTKGTRSVPDSDVTPSPQGRVGVGCSSALRPHPVAARPTSPEGRSRAPSPRHLRPGSADGIVEGGHSPPRHLGALPHDRLLRQMADAGIFVSSAVYEPFGLGVLEAAASGCALVLSDIPSFRELWDDAALFFAARDPDGLARQVNRLANDDALRTNLRALSLTRAGRYTAMRMAEETIAVYRTAMRQARRASSLREALPA